MNILDKIIHAFFSLPLFPFTSLSSEGLKGGYLIELLFLFNKNEVFFNSLPFSKFSHRPYFPQPACALDICY